MRYAINSMQSILVSACLLGNPVRYDGSGKLCTHSILAQWQQEGRVVAVCPEMAGGLPVPRPQAEITYGAGGAQVLAGLASVLDVQGQDVSIAFVHGAQQALAIAQQRGIKLAVLKDGSPSCGANYIYDGSFSGKQLAGEGVCAALLRQAGIQVFSETQWEEAHAYLQSLEVIASAPPSALA